MFSIAHLFYSTAAYSRFRKVMTLEKLPSELRDTNSGFRMYLHKEFNVLKTEKWGTYSRMSSTVGVAGMGLIM